MGSMYPRGKRIYFRVKVDGKWKGLPTDFGPGQERAAQVALDALEARLEAGEALGGVGPVTVRRFYDGWIKVREAQIRTWKNDEGVMRLHALPTIGHMRIDEVRPKHLVALATAWRKVMAPKYVYNAYSTVSALFRDALLADLISSTPCILTKHQLGPKVDKNPEWRRTAIFARDELELLISDVRIPMDRRVLYALEGVAALRHGEAAGLHWRNCGVQPPTPPLGMIYVAFSYRGPLKGDEPRAMPILPVLASILAEWRLNGWPAMMGRAPTPDDLVVPLPPAAKSKWAPYRSKGYSFDRLEQDLVNVGLRHRRGHDLRRTMISLARSDGGQKDILRRGTHKAPKEVIEGYTTFEWDVLCREVSKFRITRRGEGRVLAIPRTAAVGDSLATWLATHGGKVPEMTPFAAMALPGLEPESRTSDYAEAPGNGNAVPADSQGCEPGQAEGVPENTGPEGVARSKGANQVDYEKLGPAAGFRVIPGGGE